LANKCEEKLYKRQNAGLFDKPADFSRTKKTIGIARRKKEEAAKEKEAEVEKPKIFSSELDLKISAKPLQSKTHNISPVRRDTLKESEDKIKTKKLTSQEVTTEVLDGF